MVWEGDLEGGQGRLTADSSEVLVAMPITWDARLLQIDEAGAAGRTSAEELLAAAHASSFAMSLAAALGRAEMTAERLEVTARCRLEEGSSGFRIAEVRLVVGVRARGLDTERLQELVHAAGDRCPISRALRDNVEIALETQLLERPLTEIRPGADPEG